MPLILGTNSIKDTSYDVANSLRFDDGSSDYLNRTPSSAGNRRTFTFSFWIKRSNLGSGATLFTAGAESDTEGFFAIYFVSADNLRVTFNESSSQETTTNAKFRDPSAWSHIVVAVDTTQSTASNRVKVYHNGTQITSFSGANYPSQNYECLVSNTNAHRVGAFTNSSGGLENYFDGYMSEVVYIDGLQLAASSFGEFDADSPTIWKPIDVSDLTFGTNGFYLDFEDSSALGNDVSGNNNDFSVGNLTSIDQSTDTCTNNFATLNPLISRGSDSNQTQVLSNGNLHVTGNQASWCHSRGTFGASSGKWYWEVKLNGSTMGNLNIGVSNAGTNMFGGTVQSLSGNTSIYGDGQYNINGSITGSQSPTFSSGDICGVALNMDNNTVSFYKNGTILSWGTDLAISGGTDDVWLPASAVYNTSESLDFNFGSPPFTISSGNSDANGYGNFEYAVPSGYYALCTKNLAEYG
jgi:hypothetical protein